MKKQNDINDVELTKLAAQNLENLFYVFEQDNGQYYYNIIKTVNFPTDLDPTTYTTYITKPKDTWPLIAFNFYKDVKLWWVVCSTNGILDATKQPVPGTELKIIYANTVRDILNVIRGL